MRERERMYASIIIHLGQKLYQVALRLSFNETVCTLPLC